EQGPVLEQRRVDLGVVTHIAAPASLRVWIEGEGGHAGAVLMPDRRDAFLAAAEIALATEKAASGTGSVDTVATTGVCNVFPGAVNSIPSRVDLEIDIRDIDGSRRDSVVEALTEACEEIGARRNVVVNCEILNSDGPASCDARIVETLMGSCAEQGRSYLPMVSRAYHDSLFMSRICPVAMLFIPCRKGVSHRPDEYASIDDIANGTRVLATTLARLSE
ncbi:MAG: M20/M25/M40 family metallo-hydrolase, partial [Acidobacteriaceae bacterium]|nr:M20/M25/M40 family metallo-hydrolase [Acidobacteriaceae bacterium]